MPWISCPDLTHVATVHHETTTGRLNDLEALGAVVPGARAIVIARRASVAFGAESIDAEAWNLELPWPATANKCLHGGTGAFLRSRRDKALPRRCPAGKPIGSVYLDLFAYHAGQHGDGYSPFTQSVQVALSRCARRLAELQSTLVAGRRAVKPTSQRAAARSTRNSTSARYR